MGMYISSFLAANFLPLIFLACLLYLTLTDKGVAKNTRISMYGMIVTVGILLICDFVDITVNETELMHLWDGSIPYWMARNVASGLGYALRPILLLFSIALLYQPKKRILTLLSIPAVFNFFASVCSIKTGWVYRISAQNMWSPGPLRYVYFAIAIYYILLLPTYMFIRWKNNTPRERIAVFFVLAAILISCYLDVIVGEYHTLMLTIVGSFFMYYLCLYTHESNLVIQEQDQQIEDQKTELLAAQVQPQFIYGTLNVLCDLCTRDVAKTKEIIHTFALYLRGILDFNASEQLIPVEDEIEHTQLFSELVQTKNPHLKVEFYLNDTGFVVPYLCIQPLLEQLVSHEIPPEEENLVSVELDKEFKGNEPYHVIRICDRNHTLADAKLREKLGDNLWIKNIFKRIKNQVNGKAEIVSSAQETTVFSIWIPGKQF